MPLSNIPISSDLFASYTYWRISWKWISHIRGFIDGVPL